MEEVVSLCESLQGRCDVQGQSSLFIYGLGLNENRSSGETSVFISVRHKETNSDFGLRRFSVLTSVDSESQNHTSLFELKS